jgi:hypothetical protein
MLWNLSTSIRISNRTPTELLKAGSDMHPRTKATLAELEEASVRWDIIHLCMEAEYADLYPPGFFAAKGYWYVAGHFPCGWHRNFPKEGKLIIY